MSTDKIILGIVAEYDPFHRGHADHLSRARQLVRPDAVYTVLSPCIKQRGEFSLLSPHARAACAFHAGADAVFLLPVLWTVRDAEHYALGAVSLLCRLGVTHLAFGAETSDLSALKLLADFLEDPASSFPEVLKSFLADGSGYPSALSRAVRRYLPGADGILSSPNNILAVCYLRALKKMKAAITPVVIHRRGVYHNPVVVPEAPSAGALRGALLRGNYEAAFQSMPAFSAGITADAFLNRRIPDPSVMDSILLNCLRFSDLSCLPDLSEGLDEALKKAALESFSAAEIIARVSSRRYPASRIRRLCAMALLGVHRERIRTLSLPSAALLLALRREKALTDRWKSLPVRVCTVGKEWHSLAAPEDLTCFRLWAACCHLSDSLPFTEKVYTG